jgi:hypothetical protein
VAGGGFDTDTTAQGTTMSQREKRLVSVRRTIRRLVTAAGTARSLPVLVAAVLTACFVSATAAPAQITPPPKPGDPADRLAGSRAIGQQGLAILQSGTVPTASGGSAMAHALDYERFAPVMGVRMVAPAAAEPDDKRPSMFPQHNGGVYPSEQIYSDTGRSALRVAPAIATAALGSTVDSNGRAIPDGEVGSVVAGYFATASCQE